MSFDTPKSMGTHETGATLPLHIFEKFIKEALKDTPSIPFRTPPGVHFEKVNKDTGKPCANNDTNCIWEAFKKNQSQQTGPVPISTILEGGGEIY